MFDNNISALNAFSTSMQVTANNIANVNTDGFKHSRAELETGPGDQGVRVADIRQSTQAGPLVESLVRVEDQVTGQVSTEYQYVEGSNTDLAREFTHMIMTQRGYEANAQAIRAQDEMLGSLMDMMV